jgi:hypothetical protein
MLIDRTTETISHFLGLFALKVEQERLRDSYEEFTAERLQVDLVPVEPLAPEVDTDHELRKATPGRRSPRSPSRGRRRGSTCRLARAGRAADGRRRAAARPVGRDRDGGGAAFVILPPPAPPLPEAGVPGLDADRDGSGRAAPGQRRGGLGRLPRRVASTWPTSPPWPGSRPRSTPPPGRAAAEIPTLEDALALHARCRPSCRSCPRGRRSSPPSALRGAEDRERRGRRRGAGLEGPPARLPSGKEDEARSRGLGTARVLPPEPRAPDGHEIVAGGNLLVNEAQIALSYLDAPLIAVGGTWIDLDVVSQVALVSNLDEGVSIGDAARPRSTRSSRSRRRRRPPPGPSPARAGAAARPSRFPSRSSRATSSCRTTSSRSSSCSTTTPSRCRSCRPTRPGSSAPTSW